jgi:hypothetical protein
MAFVVKIGLSHIHGYDSFARDIMHSHDLTP